ncbi:probable nucleoredoxin 2 isoform X2 [Aristolochia californica]|uniref:probable nucleoredoxin 2 isoform X2 n=1 Tax=Aristolochia californica TaxID=171875 RepID=UPI0035E305D8
MSMDVSEQMSAESEEVISSCLLNREFFVSPGGDQVTADILKGKTIGLYFSANWYIDCQNFTPILASVYNKLKDEEAKFEVVFVSSDEDQKSFDKYYGTMPWLAIPFSDLQSKKSLTKRFQIEGIPSLIILDPCGNSIHTDGVDLIYRYGCQAFPFTSECLSNLEAEERANHASQTLEKLLLSDCRNYVVCQKDQVPISSLVGKTVGLYFSAQWCLPCMKFTPKLVSVYNRLKAKKENFEIVFVSIDKNEAGFLECYQSMPWLALPYGDENVKSLSRYFYIQGIPSLVIIGPDGKTVTKEGRNLINLYAEMAYPFTDAQLFFLQETMDEEAKNYPKSFHHAGHRHVLNLVSAASGGGPYICCECEEQGSGWAYQCFDCGYDIHPKCTREGYKDSSYKQQVRAGDTFCACPSVL